MDDSIVRGLTAIIALFGGVGLLLFAVVVFSRYFEAVEHLKNISGHLEKQTALLQQREAREQGPQVVERKQTA